MSAAASPILVVLERDGDGVKPASLRAISAARRLGERIALLCIGKGVAPLAAAAAAFGAERVYVADHELLAEPLADRYARAIADVAALAGATTVLAASGTFGRDVLPRVAALLDAPMLTDVTHLETQDGQTVYQRPVNAGRELATVTLQAERRVLTVRAGQFELPEPVAAKSPIEAIPIAAERLPQSTRLVAREERQSERPDPTEARVVVAGGRPIKDRETFERLVGRLADALGGAVGATRALVDAGIVPNDWQIGQTGKVIAPELYIAVGISGAVQHLAGIMDARVIVAINRDPTAPIMKLANYALAGDLFELVPQLTDALPQPD